MMTRYSGRGKQLEPVSPIITSEEIAEQTKEFEHKKKIKRIEKGFRADPFIPSVLRTQKEAKKAWGGSLYRKGE